MAPQYEFSPLPLQKRVFDALGGNRYRVYREDGSFAVVEAENAAEALQKSAVKNPVRILREALFLAEGLIERDMIFSQEELENAYKRKSEQEAEHAIAMAKKAAVRAPEPPVVSAPPAEPDVIDVVEVAVPVSPQEAREFAPALETDLLAAIPTEEETPVTPVVDPNPNRELSPAEIDALLTGKL